jgi:hypothetical protein
MLPPQDAAWGLAVAGRFGDRRPPFTQPALDAWIADVLAEMDLSDLMTAAIPDDLGKTTPGAG